MDRLPNNCITGGHELAQSFTYQDGRFDAPSREFRGFRMVYTANVDPSITSTTFGQDTYTKGKVLEKWIFAGSTALTQAVRRTINGWWVGSLGTNRNQVWLGSSTVYSYDLNYNGGWPYTSTANDRPDAFGNITHSYRVGSTPERLDTYTEYAAPTGSTRVHDKPSHTYSLYALSVQPVDEKWFAYDGGTQGLSFGSVDKGNVKVIKSVLDGVNDPTVHMSYDGYGNITQVQDALNHATSTGYDAKFLYPAQVTDALNHVTTTQMDYRWGKPVSVSGPNGNAEVTQYDYDAAGRLICVARPYDSTPGTLPPTNCTVKYAYTYGSAGQLSSVLVRHKEPNQTAGYPNQISGYVTATEYFDGMGRHQHTAGFRVVDGADQTVIANKVEYDPAGRVAKRYDPYTMSPASDAATPATPNNGFSTFEYFLNGSAYLDPLGRVHKVTQMDNSTRITTYQGFTTTSFDEENHKMVSTADHLGRVTEKDVYTGTGPSYTLYAWTNYTYDWAGHMLTSKQNNTASTQITMTYDTLGRKTAMTDPDSGTWQYQYDAAGNLTIQQDPKAGQHVQFCYDWLNRVVKKLYLSNDTMALVDCATTTSEMIQYAYDTGPTGTYPVGRLSTATETHPNGAVTTGMTYDARGRTLSETKTVLGKTETTSFQYDASNTDRVWKTTYPDGELVTASFDHGGQPLALAGNTSYISSVTYDLFGRAKSISHGDQTTDTRAYYGTPGSGSFPKGHRLMQLKTYPTSTPSSPYLDLSYSDFTPRGFLWHLVDNRNGGLGDVLSNTTTFGYDALGRLTSATYNYVKTANNPTTLSYSYDTLGNVLSKQSFTPISSPSASVVTQAYTYGTPAKPHQPTNVGGTAFQYDLNGNASAGSAGQIYTFDADDRLKNVNAMGGSVNFLYDYQGRRVAKLVGTSTTRYYNDLLEGTDGQLTKYYFLGGMRVAAQRINSTTYALTPDAAVQVASVAGAQPVVVLLLRRDVQFGVALSVIVVGSGLLLAPWRRKRVVGIAVRHGHVVAIIVAFGLGTLPWPLLLRPLGPAVAEAQTPPLLMHFHADHLGSTQVITQGSTGSFFRYTRYNAYGELRGHFTAAGALTNDCGTDRYCREFTGYDTEPISGLDYAGARYYDAGLGMFLSHDPAAQFASPYAYGPWNPVNGSDPTGAFWPELFLAAAAAFAVSFVTTTAQAAASGASAGQALKAGAISGAISGAAAFGLGVLGEAAGPNAAAALKAVSQVAGVSSIVHGLQTGNYVSSGVGVSLLAIGLMTQNAAQGGISRAGGENESWLQKQLDEIDARLPIGKAKIDPNSTEGGRILQAADKVAYKPTAAAIRERLVNGQLYRFRFQLGGADALTVGDNTYISAHLLADDVGYLGFQLSHEEYHFLSYQYGTVHELAIEEKFAGYFSTASVNRFTALTYPTIRDLYSGIENGYVP